MKHSYWMLRLPFFRQSIHVCVHQLIMNISVIVAGFFARKDLGSSLDLFILKIVSYCLVDHSISLLNNITSFAPKNCDFSA